MCVENNVNLLFLPDNYFPNSSVIHSSSDYQYVNQHQHHHQQPQQQYHTNSTMAQSHLVDIHVVNDNEDNDKYVDSENDIIDSDDDYDTIDIPTKRTKFNENY